VRLVAATGARLGADVMASGPPFLHDSEDVCRRRDSGGQITVGGCVSMKTAAEYRVMADKCFKWARDYMDEARETYLQLAQFWLDVASKLDGPPGSQRV
jgi:hypothetical protein